MQSSGLRLVSRTHPGSCVLFSHWYPAVAPLFRGKFWVATNFDSSPFNVWPEHGEAVRDSLQVPTGEVKQGGAILFYPRAMDEYFQFVHNDWVFLYGLEKDRVPEVLAHWREDSLDDFLGRVSEPFLRNMDGAWWDVFSSQCAAVRVALSGLPDVVVREVAFTDVGASGIMVP